MMLRRILTWLVLSFGAVVTLAALLVVVVLVVLPLPATRGWVREELQALLASALDDRVEIAHVSALSPTSVTLDGVSIGGDRPIVRARSLTLELGLPSFAPPRVALQLRLAEPTLALERDADGRWNVERWAGESEPGEEDQDLGIPRWLSRVVAEIHDGRITVEGIAPEALHLESLDLSGRLWVGLLRDSVVEIDTLTATLGDRSHLDLHGTYELEGEERLHAVLQADPLVGGDLAGLVASLREDARVSGAVEVDGALDRPELSYDLASGPARLVGKAGLRPQGDEHVVAGSFEATSVDPAKLFADVPEAALNASAEVAVRFAEAELRGVDGQLTVTDSHLFGVDVESLAVHADTTDGNVRMTIDATTPEAGLRTALESMVELAAPHRVRVSGDLELHDPVVLPTAARDYLAGSRLEAEIEADVADPLAGAPTASLALKLAPGHLRGLPLDGAEIRARLEPDLLSLDRLWIGASRTDLVGNAWVQLVETPEGRAVGGKLRGPLSLALFTNAFGVVETEVEVWGHLEDLGAVALVRTSGPVELPGLDGTFDARLDGSHLGGAAGEAELRLTGVLAPTDALARVLGHDERPAKVKVSWARTAQADAAAPLDHVEIDTSLGKRGPGAAVLQGQIDRRGDHTQVRVDGLAVHPVVGPAWTLASPATVEVRADEVSIAEARIEVGDGRIDAHGRVAGEAGPRNDLGVRIANIDVGVLCELLVVGDECSGRLGARLDVKGAAARPDVALDLTIDDISASEQRYGTLTATARTRGDALAIAARIEGGAAGSLALNGELPLEAGGRAPVLSMQRPARAELVVDGFQIDVLRALGGRAVRRLDGKATARVDLRGPLSDPRLEGSLSIVDLTFAAAATGATHRQGRVRLSIDPSRFSLEELTLDDDAITAGGQVELATGLPTAFDLWLQLDDALVVHRPEADVTGSGRVALRGPVDAPRLEGDVTIDKATIRPTIAPGGGSVEPDPSVIVVRRYGTEPGWTSGVPPELGGVPESRVDRPPDDLRVQARTPSLYENLTMMVAVRLGDSVVVRRYDANLRLYGEVYLTKMPADELRISGGIGGRQGWYIFQGRRFEIQSAYATFSGETPLDPYLNVEAQYATPDYLVRIRITGTAKHPSLDLSSDPPLDQSDILAVILFGKPAAQLNDSQGQVLQSQAFALLASYVAPELQRSVLDTFGLTSLTFSMPTGDTAGTIGVGRYFGDDLFISVARDFGGPSGGTNRQLQGLVGSSVTIQYSLTPSVTLQGASSTEGESSVDVIWHRRY